MTSIEDFTSQYGLVQKIDAFGYLDYLKKNPDAPRKHGKVVLVTADTPLKASRGEGKTTTTIALIDALRERGIDAAAVLRQPSMGITAAGSKGGASGGGWVETGSDGKPALVSNTSIGPVTSGWLAGPRFGDVARGVYKSFSDRFAGN